MKHWLRFAGQIIYRTPTLMMALVLIVAAWMAAAEIYEVVIQIPGHGETAAMVLMGLNVLCSWLLFFNLLAVLHDMQELRLPQHRRLLTLGLFFIFGFIFVLPCLLVWLLHGSARDVLMVATGSAVGCAGAMLWRRRFRARRAPADRRSVAEMRPIPVQPPNPWRAVRVALGPPYAPASWRRRGMELVALGIIVAGAPIMVVLYERSLQPRAFPFVLRAAEFIGFLAAIGLCWAWPLSRLLAIFNPERGALSELALLPGMGNGRQQFRRLYLTALSVPAAGLGLLLLSALLLVTLQHMPRDVYLRLAVNFVLVPLITLPILIGWIAGSRATATWSATLLMTLQPWTFSILVWSRMWDAGAPDTPAVHTLRGLTVGIVLVGLVVVIGFSMHSLRKLLRRPHPFVEIPP